MRQKCEVNAAFTESLKTQVEIERKSKADLERKHLSALTFIQRAFGIVVCNKRLLIKKDLSAADFESAHPTVHRAVSNPPQNQAKLSFSAKKNPQTQYKDSILKAGKPHRQSLFEEDCGKRAKTRAVLLHVLKTVQSVLVVAFSLNTDFRDNVENKVQTTPANLAFQAGRLFGFLLIICGIELVVNYLEETAKVQIRRWLESKIYFKLSLCSSQFLDQSDNNLIVKLLYTSLDDYCANKFWKTSILGLCSWAGAFIYLILKEEFRILPVFFLMVFLRFLLNMVFEVFKQVFKQMVKTRSYHTRKIAYEFVNEFKGFNLKNLRNLFVRRSAESSERKVKDLMRFWLACRLESLYLEMVYSSVIAFVVIKYFIDLSNQHPISSKPFDSKDIQIPIYFKMVSLDFLSFLLVPRTSNLFSSYSLYRKSSKFLEQFFASEFTIQLRKAQAANPKGEIKFENCYIPETVQRNLKDFFDWTHNQTNETVLIKNLSMKIPAGSVLCVFENDQKKKINGFIDLILGEKTVTDGNVYLNGSISYFNPTKSQLLVGKTIRENILFGSEYVQDRYEEILKIFGVQFGYYKGYDFHQVGEKGLNIRTEDLRTILFARFLYQDCDIYLIQDYFANFDTSLMLGQIKVIIKHVLQHKTVVYCSNNVDLIKLSDMVITFEEQDEYHVVPTKVFLGNVGENRRPTTVFNFDDSPGLRRPPKRTEVLQNKVKNSIFIANLNFEEELAICKKIEAKRLEVDSFKRNNSDFLSLLVYGFRLVQEKREEGRYLEEEKIVSEADVIQALKSIKKEHPVFLKRVVGTLLVKILADCCFLAAECLLFNLAFEQTHTKSRAFSNYLLPMLSLLAASGLINMVRVFIVSRVLVSRTRKINNLVLSHILNSSIRWILKSKHHQILNYINIRLHDIETDMPMIVRSAMHIIAEVFCSCVITCYCLGGLPVLVFAGLFYLYYSLSRQLMPVYMNIWKYYSTIESKIDDLNFQLLSLIGGYRIAGRIGALLNHLDNLCNSRDAVLQSKSRGLELFLGIVATLGLITWTVLMLTIVVGCWLGWLNFFGVNKACMAWGGFTILKLIPTLHKIPKSLLLILKFFVKYAKLANFLGKDAMTVPKLESEHAEGQVKCIRKLDLSAPIVLRNVSLTRGVQPVLKKVSLTIKPGSLVAIFGVEGGGRSHIFELLTKVIERDPLDKSGISLFGRTIEEVSERQIQRSVFLIERNPALFEGTIRQNMDPYCKHSDEQLIKVMREAKIGLLLIKYLSEEQPIGEQKSKKPLTSFQLNIQPCDKVLAITSPNRRQSKDSAIRGFSRKLSQLKGTKKINEQQAQRKKCSLVVASDSFTQKAIFHQRKLSQKIPALNLPRMALQRANCTVQNGSFEVSLENKISHEAEDLYLQFDGEVVESSNHKSKLPASQSDIFSLSKQKSRSIRNNSQLNESFNRSSSIFDIKKRRSENFKTLQKNKELSNTNDLLKRADVRDSQAEPKSGKHSDTEKIEQSSQAYSRSKALLSQSLKKANQNIILNSPYKTENRLDTEEEIEKNYCKELRADAVFLRFLSGRVAFEGRNLNPEVRGSIVFCRALLEEPAILLTYEDSLAFGRGVEDDRFKFWVI